MAFEMIIIYNYFLLKWTYVFIFMLEMCQELLQFACVNMCRTFQNEIEMN